MIELNKWFFVLLVNFLVLLYVLNKILFKPMLKIFSEREDAIKGSLSAANAMTQKKEEAFARLKSELTAAREKAKTTFETIRAEGLNIQKEIFAKAEAEASGILNKARAEIKTEAAKSRLALRADIDKLSDDIVRKLLKA